jgi:hypothetical protein
MLFFRSSCLVFILLVLIPKTSLSQLINIEDKRLNSDEDGWIGNIDFNAKYTKNINSVWQLSNKISIQYRKKKYTHLFLNDISLVRSDQNDLVNYGFAHYRLSREIPHYDFITWESFTQIQYNSVQKIRQRTLLGTGLRFNIVDTDSIYFTYGFALMYEYEETTIPEFSNTIRNSNYLSFDWKISKVWEFKTIIYYQPSIGDFSDYRLSNVTNLSHLLTEHISLVFNLNLLYDSEPPIDVPVNSFQSGLLVRFKF